MSWKTLGTAPFSLVLLFLILAAVEIPTVMTLTTLAHMRELVERYLPAGMPSARHGTMWRLR